MSQNTIPDFVTDDPEGPDIAEDLNNIWQNITTQHSGASAPAYAGTGIVWWNTTDDVLQVYDGTDHHKILHEGWDNLPSLAGLTLAEGDILYATGADTLAKLAKGTAGQMLQMNSDATAPEWGDAGLNLVAKETLVDSTTYTTTSASYVVYKEYLITETAADSRLFATLNCQVSPFQSSRTGGLGQDQRIACVDSLASTQTIDSILLSTLTNITYDDSNATVHDLSGLYMPISLTLPELPQAAKIDLTPHGGTGTGWRVRLSHSSNGTGTTARTSRTVLSYTEIENV